MSDGDQGLAFFDECAEKVSAYDDTPTEIRFVDWDTGHSSDRTKFILPPEYQAPTAGQTFSYMSFSLNPALLKQSRRTHLSNFAHHSIMVPGSPMARRTKHEIKTAQKLGRKSQTNPETWAKYLLATCYSIYFLVLPSVLLESPASSHATLKSAYDLLSQAAKLKIVCDEVCYRVMMQLCGINNLPILAVRLYYLMKRSGVQPNALTYGFYNRCVLEAQWPSDSTTSSKLRWNRLKNVVIGAAHFRRAGRKHFSTRKTIGSDTNLNTLEGIDGASRTSLDSANSMHHTTAEPSAGNQAIIDFSAFDRLKGRLGSIVRQSGPQESSDMLSSAGLLISSEGANKSPNASKKPPPSPCDLNASRSLVRSDSFGGDSKLMNKLSNFHAPAFDEEAKSDVDLTTEANSSHEELRVSNGDLSQLTSPAK